MTERLRPESLRQKVIKALTPHLAPHFEEKILKPVGKNLIQRGTSGKTEEQFKNVPSIGMVGAGIGGVTYADSLRRSGARVVVYEGSSIPFGKTHDQIPFWHSNQKKLEIEKMLWMLSQPGIQFVPNAWIDESLLPALYQQHDFVRFAHGATIENPLTAKVFDPSTGENNEVRLGIDLELSNVTTQGQHIHEMNQNWAEGNSFWKFAHDSLKKYPDLLTKPSIVVGGGLASYDVIKSLSLTRVVLGLERYFRQHDVTKLPALEKFVSEKIEKVAVKGLKMILEEFGVSLEELNLPKLYLVYRRKKSNMEWRKVGEKDLDRDLKLRTYITDREAEFDFIVREERSVNTIHHYDGKLLSMTLSGKKEEDAENYEPAVVISSIGSKPVTPDSHLILGDGKTGKGNLKSSSDDAVEAAHSDIQALLKLDQNPEILTGLPHYSGLELISYVLEQAPHAFLHDWEWLPEQMYGWEKAIRNLQKLADECEKKGLQIEFTNIVATREKPKKDDVKPEDMPMRYVVTVKTAEDEFEIVYTPQAKARPWRIAQEVTKKKVRGQSYEPVAFDRLVNTLTKRKFLVA
jgi:hypothetical protein